MKLMSFLARRGIEFSVRRYGVDALNYMSLGLFSSLIVGLILKTLGGWADLPWLVDVGTQAQKAMGAAIGVAVARALQAPPLVLFASVATGLAGAAAGGPVGCFVAAAVGAEAGKLVSRTTPIDIIVAPAVTLCAGLLAAQWAGPAVARLMADLGSFIMWAVELRPFMMGMVVATAMGLLLTLPTSSAAVAISLSLGGLAAGAATVGCCAQMVGFAVMSYSDNGVAGLLSQGLGTSMLQMPNIVKNPRIWIPPTLSGVVLGPLSTLVFRMTNVPSGAGMGTSGLVGQVGTLEAMGGSLTVWGAIVLLHFVLPVLLTLICTHWCRRRGWIRPGDLKLDL